MSVFPITFEDKVDSPEFIAWLATFGAEKKMTAAEINLVRDALNELHTTKVPIVGGKIPSEYLPSYVDDVLEFLNLASFPVIGEIGKIYIALDSNYQYRWTGTTYVQFSSGIEFPASDDFIYGVKNKLSKRIDNLLTDNLIFAHTCQTGTTLYGTIVTAGNSAFSLGSHANYGSLLNAVAASKVTSAATLGSVACYRNSFSHINSTAAAKFKTETFITITNAVAPLTSRLCSGFVNYSWSGGSNVNPSAHAILSFCNDDGEDYLKFCHRKIDGTVGVLSMGNLFPAKFINQAHVYQCCFYFIGNHHGFATIKDLVTGNYFESAIVEVYKSFESNGLTFVNHINNNTTAEAVGFAQSGHITKYIYGL